MNPLVFWVCFPPVPYCVFLVSIIVRQCQLSLPPSPFHSIQCPCVLPYHLRCPEVAGEGSLLVLYPPWCFFVSPSVFYLSISIPSIVSQWVSCFSCPSPIPDHWCSLWPLPFLPHPVIYPCSPMWSSVSLCPGSCPVGVLSPLPCLYSVPGYQYPLCPLPFLLYPVPSPFLSIQSFGSWCLGSCPLGFLSLLACSRFPVFHFALYSNIPFVFNLLSSNAHACPPFLVSMDLFFLVP